MSKLMRSMTNSIRRGVGGGGSYYDLMRAATVKTMFEPNQSANNRVCDAILTQACGPVREAVQELKDRLNQENPFKIYLAVRLTEQVLHQCNEVIGLYTGEILNEVASVAARIRTIPNMEGPNSKAKRAAIELLSSHHLGRELMGKYGIRGVYDVAHNSVGAGGAGAYGGHPGGMQGTPGYGGAGATFGSPSGGHGFGGGGGGGQHAYGNDYGGRDDAIFGATRESIRDKISNTMRTVELLRDVLTSGAASDIDWSLIEELEDDVLDGQRYLERFAQELAQETDEEAQIMLAETLSVSDELDKVLRLRKERQNAAGQAQNREPAPPPPQLVAHRAAPAAVYAPPPQAPPPPTNLLDMDAPPVAPQPRVYSNPNEQFIDNAFGPGPAAQAAQQPPNGNPFGAPAAAPGPAGSYNGNPFAFPTNPPPAAAPIPVPVVAPPPPPPQPAPQAVQSPQPYMVMMGPAGVPVPVPTGANAPPTPGAGAPVARPPPVKGLPFNANAVATGNAPGPARPAPTSPPVPVPYQQQAPAPAGPAQVSSPPSYYGQPAAAAYPPQQQQQQAQPQYAQRDPHDPFVQYAPPPQPARPQEAAPQTPQGPAAPDFASAFPTPASPPEPKPAPVANPNRMNQNAAGLRAAPAQPARSPNNAVPQRMFKDLASLALRDVNASPGSDGTVVSPLGGQTTPAAYRNAPAAPANTPMSGQPGAAPGNASQFGNFNVINNDLFGVQATPRVMGGDNQGDSYDAMLRGRN